MGACVVSADMFSFIDAWRDGLGGDCGGFESILILLTLDIADAIRRMTSHETNLCHSDSHVFIVQVMRFCDGPTRLIDRPETQISYSLSPQTKQHVAHGKGARLISAGYSEYSNVSGLGGKVNISTLQNSSQTHKKLIFYVNVNITETKSLIKLSP
jgi:hypothetical protein